MHHHHREKIQHKHCSKVDTFFGSVSPPRKQPSAPDPNKKTPSDFPLTRIPPRQIRFAFVVRKPYARRCHGVTWDSFFGRWRCFGVSVTSKGFKFWKTNNKQMATFGGRHIQLWMVWTKIEGWLQRTTRMEFSIRQDTHTHISQEYSRMEYEGWHGYIWISNEGIRFSLRVVISNARITLQ